jgi:hypothetical protein
MVQNVQAVQVVQGVCPHPDLPPRQWKEADSLPPLRGRLKKGGCNAELGDGLNGLNDWNVLNKRAVPVP